MLTKKNKLLEALNSPKEFYRQLIEIRDEKELVNLCTQLKSEFEIDYFQLAISSINDGQDIYLLTHTLEKIAYLSILDTKNILSLYDTLFNQGQNSFYNITKNICDNNEEFAKDILKSFYLIDKEYITFHISTIIVSLHNTHGTNQYQNVKSFLTNNKNIIKTKSAIDTIDKISINEEESKEIYSLFQNIIKLKNLEFNYLIIQVSNNLKNTYPSFKNLLVQCSKFENGNIRFHISQVLMFNKKEFINEDWFKECLLSLKSTQSKEVGTIQNIAFTLNHIVEETNSINLTKEFFLIWIENSDISSNFPDKKLDIFINEITKKHPNLTNKLITHIFNSENKKIHLILHHFISSKTELDTTVLDSLNDIDLLFICRKILGYLYQFEEQKSLVLSILKKKNINKDTVDLVNEVFINYIGDDYPYETLEYFQNMKYRKLTKHEKYICDTVIKNLESKNEMRKNLKRLKELQPSISESREINKANNNSMRKMMDKAQEDSIFSQIATKILIKYGKGNFSNINNKYTEPTEMHTMSTSIAIPTSERAHPIYKSIEKYHFKIAKKEDK